MRAVILLIACIRSVQGLQCLQCQGVESVENCTWSGTCSQHEACYTRSLVSYKGNKIYQMGCAHENLCRSLNFQTAIIGRRESEVSQGACDMCCYKDNCNGKLCLQNNLVGKDCLDLRKRGYTTSKVYLIKPDGGAAFSVYCDMTTEGGGWTMFQRRHGGPLKFTRSWAEFRNGFGNLSGEFWLGNDKLHRLTAARHCGLRLTHAGRYAEYSTFSVASESDNYRIHFSGYHGNDGNPLVNSVFGHYGMQFTTYDRDNDLWGGNCVVKYGGGWWYNHCYTLNLNVNGVVTSTMSVR